MPELSDRETKKQEDTARTTAGRKQAEGEATTWRIQRYEKGGGAEGEKIVKVKYEEKVEGGVGARP